MKCTCSECDGSGKVECPECDGEGVTEGSILHIHIPGSHAAFEEVNALKQDAIRVTRQAKILKELRPNRAPSYDQQLRSALAEIERQAEKVLEEA